LIVLSGLVGVTLPALSATLRALWPRLAPGAGDRAYALDTLSYEMSLIASPALVGAVAVAGSPSLALLVIAVLGITGTGVVATAPAARARAHTAGSVDRIGRGVTHAVLLLIAVSLFVGAAEGAMTVLAPAVASAQRDHAAGGLLLSCLAGGSLVGALAYGSFGDRGTLAQRLVAATAGLTLAFLLLALFGSTLVGFAVCAALVGLVLSPTLTIGFVAIRHTAPFGSLTETFTWASFAATAGAAASQALAGLTVAGPGAETALWIPMAFAAGALAAATVRRQAAHGHREVHPSPPPAERSASDCAVRPEAVTQRS
jgi:hypothetical protein